MITYRHHHLVLSVFMKLQPKCVPLIIQSPLHYWCLLILVHYKIHHLLTYLQFRSLVIITFIC